MEARFIAACALAVALGCTSTATPQPQPQPQPTEDRKKDPAPPEPAKKTVPEGPIHFVWTDFHFEMGGTAVLDIDDKKVRELLHDSRQERDRGQRVTVMFFRYAEYEITEDEAKRLRDAVSSPEFLALEPKFINEDIQDGTTQTFTVLAGEHEQDVYTYQEWPAPVERLRKEIRAIQAAHEDERKKAPEAGRELSEKMRADAKKFAAAAGRVGPG